MSKADTLGPAPAFSAVRSARRNAISKIGSADATEALSELPVTVVSENPDNPRNHLRDMDAMVDTVREVGVLLPIVVASADAYLRERPDRARDLDNGAQYVVVDGHRRLEAARRLGLATIPVRVDNARVATDEALLEAAFIANVQRSDMTDLEEAHALQQLVDYYGSQTKASKRLGISQSAISSKLSLLKLTPELQKDLMTGERTAEHVRNLGKLSPEQQKQKADERAEVARRKSQARPVERSAGPADYHAVISHEKVTEAEGVPAAPASAPAPENRAEHRAPAPERPARVEAAVPQQPAAAAEVVPPTIRTASEQGSAEAASSDRSLPRLPYDDGQFIAHHLIRKMPPDAFTTALRVMNAHAAEQGLDVLPDSTV